MSCREERQLWGMQLHTCGQGNHAGHVFTLYTLSLEQRQRWSEKLKSGIQIAVIEHDKVSKGSVGRVGELQDWLKIYFDHKLVQAAMALIICMAFVTNIINTEYLPEEGSSMAQVMYRFEWFYTVIYIYIYIHICICICTIYI